VVVLPLVVTVVVALVLPDLVVTVLVDAGAFVAATAGVAMMASAATELISFFIQILLVSGSSGAGADGDIAPLFTASFHGH
jgi:hypothetical protein